MINFLILFFLFGVVIFSFRFVGFFIGEVVIGFCFFCFGFFRVGYVVEVGEQEDVGEIIGQKSVVKVDGEIIVYIYGMKGMVKNLLKLNFDLKEKKKF